ncbi:MAG: dioxygenase [Gammaproteobacteria bacterium]|nr:dioxygenase [Gammaproteobacteria bacterium]
MNNQEKKDLMPVLFVSHGNPMASLNEKSEKEYGAWGASLPKAKAVLMFSAHWEAEGLIFGETKRHERLIYDFFGFPKKLYDIQYPAPAAKWLEDEVQNLLTDNISASERGLDHGVWIPLSKIWPNADVPILQISLPKNYSNQALFDLGQRLSPLRQQGVMIIGGGTLTHNLKEGLSGKYSETPEWVRNFDDWVAQVLRDDRTALLDWENTGPKALLNHPSPEHFRPLLIVAGAAMRNETPTFPLVGFDMALFSKRSVQFG